MTYRSGNHAFKSLGRRWVLPALLLLCALIYLRGLFGGFLFDDFPNIVNKPELRAVDGSLFRWLALALSSDAGPLRRPVSMLSFGLDYYLFGLSPLAFKLTNLVIHLTNGVVLYQLARRLAARLLPEASRMASTPRGLALLATAWWLLHPLNVSTVLYVVQRMDELSSLFVLLGLLFYAEGRERMLRGERGIAICVASIAVFGVLAAFSKESGALITAFALVIEVFCYRFAAKNQYEIRVLKMWFWLTVALPIGLFLVYLVVHPQWLANGYAGRDFTIYQRVLSEPRILCSYLLWIFLPNPHWMGVFHDDFLVSSGLMHPATTIMAIVFLIALVVIALSVRDRSPGFAFAVAWFLIGQSMESTIIPLELIFDHRNYLPMAGLLLGVICAMAPWVYRKLDRRVVGACCGSLILALSCITAFWANAWGNPLRLATTEAADHPGSARAQYEAGRELIFKGATNHQRAATERQATPYFMLGMRIDPTDIYSLVGLMQIYAHQDPSALPKAIDDLTSRVRHTSSVDINPFLIALSASIDGSIRIDPSQMKPLVYAALDNPRFSNSMRAMILNDYGHYMLQIAHDDQAAISLTMAAAAEDPANPLLEVNLAKLAMSLGNRNQARIHLLKADRLDKTRIYSMTLAELKRQLLAADDTNQAQANKELH